MQDEYDKLKLEVQASENAFTQQLNALKSALDTVQKEISTYKMNVGTVEEKIKGLTGTTQELEANLAQLKKEHQDLQQQLDKNQAEKKSLTETIDELENSKRELESKIGNNERIKNELQSAISQLNSKIKNIKKDLESADQLYDVKVTGLELEVMETKDKTNNIGNQYKILRHLLETGYVGDSHYDVIKVLKQPGVSTLDQLVLASGVGKQTVEKTLNELNSRKVVVYDSMKGSFSVEKKIDI